MPSTPTATERNALRDLVKQQLEAPPPGEVDVALPLVEDVEEQPATREHASPVQRRLLLAK